MFTLEELQKMPYKELQKLAKSTGACRANAKSAAMAVSLAEHHEALNVEEAPADVEAPVEAVGSEHEHGCASSCSFSDGESDEDNQDDDAIQIANVFHEAVDCAETESEKAVELFEEVVRLEAERGVEVIWRLKALVNLITLFHKLDRFEEMGERHDEMLTHLGSVTSNECTSSISGLLTVISGMSNLGLMSSMTQRTLSTLKDASNHRQWFNMNVELGKLYVEMKRYGSRV
jgi:hypothetical protein